MPDREFALEVQAEHERQKYRQPYLARVQSVSEKSDQLQYSSWLGDKDGDTLHPYIANDSWIRVMPEVGAGVIQAFRGDELNPVTLSYFDEIKNALRRTRNYDTQRSMWRALKPGEWQFMSVGLAEVWGSVKGHMELRGGMVQWMLDNKGLTQYTHSPMHEKRGLNFNNSQLSDLQRFGVVRRPSDAISNKYPEVSGQFAQEYLTRLDRDGNPLVDLRGGDVFDDFAQRQKSSETNKFLRMWHRYYTEANTPVEFEIDIDGNVIWRLPSKADKGLIAKIPGGGAKLSLAKDLVASISGAMNFRVSDNLTMRSDKDVRFNGVRVVLQSGTQPVARVNDSVKVSGATGPALPVGPPPPGGVPPHTHNVILSGTIRTGNTSILG